MASVCSHGAPLASSRLHLVRPPPRQVAAAPRSLPRPAAAPAWTEQLTGGSWGAACSRTHSHTARPQRHASAPWPAAAAYGGGGAQGDGADPWQPPAGTSNKGDQTGESHALGRQQPAYLVGQMALRSFGGLKRQPASRAVTVSLVSFSSFIWQRLEQHGVPRLRCTPCSRQLQPALFCVCVSLPPALPSPMPSPWVLGQGGGETTINRRI